MHYELFVQSALEFLEKAYTRAESKTLLELLMAKYKMPSIHHALYLHTQDEVPTDTLKAILADIDRLLLHEPIQYLEETVSFGTLELKVDPSVLIPRPETEELTEFIKSDFNTDPRAILDIGTGSGCIAISMYKKWPQAKVTAIDVSAEALLVAQQNVNKNKAKLELLQLDVLAESMPESIWDIIVSNPPYIAHHESQNMSPNVLDYEPHLALFAEGDATIFYTQIINYATKHLAPLGKVYFECNPLTIERVQSYAQELGLSSELREDSYGKLRFMKLWRD